MALFREIGGRSQVICCLVSVSVSVHCLTSSFSHQVLAAMPQQHHLIHKQNERKKASAIMPKPKSALSPSFSASMRLSIQPNQHGLPAHCSAHLVPHEELTAVWEECRLNLRLIIRVPLIIAFNCDKRPAKCSLATVTFRFFM